MLLANEADVQDKTRNFPLHIVLSEPDILVFIMHVIRLLLECGVDLDALNNWYETPLDVLERTRELRRHHNVQFASHTAFIQEQQ